MILCQMIADPMFFPPTRMERRPRFASAQSGPQRTRFSCAGVIGAANLGDRNANYFIAPLDIAISELKISQSVSHFPSTFLEYNIHLPWSA
jgi:hypothetical protein